MANSRNELSIQKNQDDIEGAQDTPSVIHSEPKVRFYSNCFLNALTVQYGYLNFNPKSIVQLARLF